MAVKSAPGSGQPHTVHLPWHVCIREQRVHAVGFRSQHFDSVIGIHGLNHLKPVIQQRLGQHQPNDGLIFDDNLDERQLGMIGHAASKQF